MQNIFPLLAEVDSPEMRLGVWMVCLASALAIANSIKNLFFRKPSIDAEFATKVEVAGVRGEVRKVETDLADFRDDVDGKLDQARVEHTRDIASLHEKINGIATGVSYIRGKMDEEQKHKS